MASPVGRLLAQIGFAAVTTFGKAFGKAFKAHAEQAAHGAAAQAGQKVGSAAAGHVWTGRMMRPEEAYRVLNIDPKAINPQPEIQQNYERLFRVNDVTQGGSFYLQSKIVRAKQTLDRIHHPNASSSSTASASPSSQSRPDS